MPTSEMILKIKYPDVPYRIAVIMEYINSVYKWEHRVYSYKGAYIVWYDNFYIRIFDEDKIVYDSSVDAEEDDLDYVLGNAEMYLCRYMN